jgi:amino acid adenylation domain-containing protein
MIEMTDRAVRGDVEPLGQSSLIELVTAVEEAHATSVALLDAEGRTFNYAQLRNAYRGLASRLIDAGVMPGDRVPTYCIRTADTVIAMLGIWAAGACYVPLSDSQPESRARQILDGVRASVLVRPAAGPSWLDGLSLHQIVVGDADGPVLDEIREAPAGSDAYIFYTSGSTGQPKGVRVGHKAAINAVLALNDWHDFRAGEAFVQSISFGFDPSIWTVLWPLSHGGTVIVASSNQARDPAELSRLAAKHQTRAMLAPPPMLTLLSNLPEFARLTSLATIVAGGETFATALLDRVHSLLPGVRVCNVYGPTEAAIHVTAWISDRDQKPETAFLPLGRPIANTTVSIAESADGPWGEIVLSGTCVGNGYVGGNTVDSGFTTDPTEPAGRIYRTGDLGTIDADGLIHFHGRRDEQVKIRGQRVELAEVRRTIEGISGVMTVAACTATHAGSSRIEAYIVAPGIDDNTLRAAIRNSLPEYMRPEILVCVPDLPVNENGKTDFERLRAQWDCTTEAASPASDNAIDVAAVRRVWGKVLAHDNFSDADNFFDVGGHSIKMLELQREIKAALRRDVNLAEMFKLPSVASLTAYLNGEASAKIMPQATKSLSPRERLLARRKRL